MEHNVLNYLDHAAQAWPERAAFTDERESMTFAALRQASRAVGSALTAYTSPRDSVAVLMNDRSTACVAGMLGVVQAGCAYSPPGRRHAGRAYAGDLRAAEAGCHPLRRHHASGGGKRSVCLPCCDVRGRRGCAGK